MSTDLTGVEFVVLGLLAEASRHGYDLENLIAARGMREWTDIGFSSIYYGLNKLEAAGLVSAAQSGGAKARKIFSITEAGRAVLARQALLALAEPQAPRPRLLMGLANWPALEAAEGLAALEARAAALREEAARLDAARAAQQPLPDFADALFDYAASLIAAETAWLARTRGKLAMAEKIDFRKTLKALYQPGRAFGLIEVPKMNFIKVDGAGDPNSAEAYKRAVEWLYAVSYAAKFGARAATGQDYVVPPLEGLWWAEGHDAAFVARDYEKWQWTMMIMLPDFVPRAVYDAAVAKAGKTLGAPPDSLRLEALEEGLCVQVLHVGSYADETPVLARLHKEFLPSQGLVENGLHHEIYLSDPRKVAPEKLKTVLRQPVRLA